MKSRKNWKSFVGKKKRKKKTENEKKTKRKKRTDEGRGHDHARRDAHQNVETRGIFTSLNRTAPEL